MMKIIEKDLLEEIGEVESSMEDLYGRGVLSKFRYDEFKRLMGNLRVLLGVDR